MARIEPGMHLALADQVGDPPGQHPGLARAGARPRPAPGRPRAAPPHAAAGSVPRAARSGRSSRAGLRGAASAAPLGRGVGERGSSRCWAAVELRCGRHVATHPRRRLRHARLARRRIRSAPQTSPGPRNIGCMCVATDPVRTVLKHAAAGRDRGPGRDPARAGGRRLSPQAAAPAGGRFPRLPPRSVTAGGSEVTVYTYGEDLYHDMLDAIRQAKSRGLLRDLHLEGRRRSARRSRTR